MPEYHLLVGPVKIEILQPSSSDGFRMTGKVVGRGEGEESKRDFSLRRPTLSRE
jgi:hypothetical protein